MTFASKKCSITPTIKKAYFLYFGCKIGDQDKNGHHTCAALRVHPNSIRRLMVKDAVCRLERPWFGVCLATTELTVISVWRPLFKMVCPCKKNQHFCIRIYHQQFGLCLMATDVLFLKLRTILLCTLTTKAVFLQTAQNSSHQLQEMADYLPSTDSSNQRSQNASSMTSSGISNFQNKGRTFGIKVTTVEFTTTQREMVRCHVR